MRPALPKLNKADRFSRAGFETTLLAVRAGNEVAIDRVNMCVFAFFLLHMVLILTAF